jgi:anti-anti-sigma regulatory factor
MWNSFKEKKMGSIRIERGKDEVCLSLEGRFTVEGAVDCKEALLNALAEGKPVHLECSAVTETDITFWQLVRAAQVWARTIGSKVSLARPLPQEMQNMLEGAGLERFFEDSQEELGNR